MHSFRSLAALLGLAALALPLTVHAQTTVFTTFGPDNAFSPNNGWVAAGPTSDYDHGASYIATGEGFVPTASGNLSSIKVAVFNFSGTNDAHFFLADGSSGLPGTILEGFTASGIAPEFPNSDTLTDFASVAHPFLTAGQEYFLYESEPGNENNGWADGEQGKGDHATSVSGGPFTIRTATQSAFSVQVVPAVPEASTMLSFGLLLALGPGALVVAKRKSAVRQTAIFLPR